MKGNLLYSENLAIWRDSEHLFEVRSTMTIFLGKREKQSQLIIKVRGQILCHFSIECRPLTSPDPFFGPLYCPHGQHANLLRGSLA